MRYNLIDSDKSLKDSDFSLVEKIIGKKIPESMLMLYRMHNGGRVEGGRNIFIHPENGMEYEVKTFLPMVHVRHKKDSSVEENYIFFCKKEKIIPEEFIPFAIDSGGFVYCMDSVSEKVYFFNFDNPGESKEFIANSLNEFVDSLITTEEAGF